MAQITVNGRSYELVTLDDLTLDEAIVVWDYAGLSLDQIDELEGFHPGVVAALIHIAVARGEPAETAKTIRQAVGAIKVVDLQAVFMDISEETDELPPPSAPAESSPADDSGATGNDTSDPGPELSAPNGSGSRGSEPGAISDRVTSAA